MSQGPSTILLKSDASEIPWGAFHQDLSASHIVVLLYQFTADQWVSEWNDYVSGEQASMQILSAQSTQGNGSVSNEHLLDTEEIPITEITPRNLTKTGTQITTALSAIDGSDHPVVVYCDSIGSLIQFSDLKTTYRFLHTLIGHVLAVSGTLYIQIDPVAHDEKTLSTLLHLFDEVVET